MRKNGEIVIQLNTNIDNLNIGEELVLMKIVQNIGDSEQRGIIAYYNGCEVGRMPNKNITIKGVMDKEKIFKLIKTTITAKIDKVIDNYVFLKINSR